jgi:hypothetical protein
MDSVCRDCRAYQPITRDYGSGVRSSNLFGRASKRLIGLSFSTRSDLLLPEAARLEAAWKQERCDTDFSSRYIADRPLLAWMLGKAPSPTPDWTGPAGRPVYPYLNGLLLSWRRVAAIGTVLVFLAHC